MDTRLRMKLLDAIESLDPSFPKVDPEVSAEFKRLKTVLEADRGPKVRKK